MKRKISQEARQKYDILNKKEKTNTNKKFVY